MPASQRGRSLLAQKDFAHDEIRYLPQLAADLKAKKRAGIEKISLPENIVLLFEKRPPALAEPLRSPLWTKAPASPRRRRAVY